MVMVGLGGTVEGRRGRWRRGTWIGEALHRGGCEDGNGSADGALASKVDAAPVGEVDAVENVVIQEGGFRDVGVDGGSRDGGRKVGIGKGSRIVGRRRLALVVPIALLLFLLLLVGGPRPTCRRRRGEGIRRR